jgi:hypothetical protein
LPKSSKCLRHTPKKLKIFNLSPGKYIHIGLDVCLRVFLGTLRAPLPSMITLDLNIDGAPIYKNSHSHGVIWPILCRVKNLNSDVFVVGIYGGNAKPHDFQAFLNFFICDFLNLQNEFEFEKKK